MKFGLRFVPNAEKELEDAYEWIHERSPQAADRWREEIIAAISSLRDSWRVNPPAPENGRFPFEIRQLLFGKRRGQFRIIYSVIDNDVVVVAVRHSARRPLDNGDIILP